MAAAMEFNRDFKTVGKALKRSGCEPDADGKYSVAQVHRALFTDLEAEKIRETRHKANLLEMEEAERKRSLVKTADLMPWANKVLAALTAAIMSSKLLSEEQRDVLHSLEFSRKELADLAKPDGEKS